jgi:hypothetical protein
MLLRTRIDPQGRPMRAHVLLPRRRLLALVTGALAAGLMAAGSASAGSGTLGADCTRGTAVRNYGANIFVNDVDLLPVDFSPQWVQTKSWLYSAASGTFVAGPVQRTYLAYNDGILRFPVASEPDFQLNHGWYAVYLEASVWNGTWRRTLATWVSFAPNPGGLEFWCPGNTI